MCLMVLASLRGVALVSKTMIPRVWSYGINGMSTFYDSLMYANDIMQGYKYRKCSIKQK